MATPTTQRVILARLPKGASSLTYETAAVPTPKPNEFLIKVHAAGIIWTELTWDALYYDQTTYAPRDFIPGCDFAGVVIALGSDIKSDECGIDIGSEVYALTSNPDKHGSMAEYTVATLEQVALKPKGLTMEEAASMPLSALTAWQALFEHAGFKKGMDGMRVLVTGAAGGTGVFAVPLAKWKGATVVGTAGSVRSFEMLKELGCDEIVDYKNDGWDKDLGDFDAVLDCVGGETLEKCWGLGKKGGWLCSVTVNPWHCKEEQERGQKMGVRTSFFIVKGSAEQLGELAGLVEKGVLKAAVDEVFPFEKATEAFIKGEGGHVHGKLVLRVLDDARA
jgi:NADPH:quinone reductase-like Zn-dependent oxidoreductase